MPSPESPSLEERLAAVEARLGRLERLVLGSPDTTRHEWSMPSRPSAPAATPDTTPGAAPPITAAVTRQPAPGARPAPIAAAARPAQPEPAAHPHSRAPEASAWLAWSGSIAFVLAASYFLKLVYDSGWLTPERQIGLAVLGGIALIAIGLHLARVDRPYAGYLPATGIVVLYGAAYAAHAYYHLIQAAPAVFAVGAITLLSIWLHRRFEQTVFAFFAVVGTYSFPLMIEAESVPVTDLVIYFGAWALLFSLASVLEGKRTIYLFALYFSLIGFEIAWRGSAGPDAWAAASIFQFGQFVLFASTATWFSIVHRAAMNDTEALLHGGALLFFYVAEYIVLKQHVPDLAPYVALASVVVALALYFLARARLAPELEAGASAALVSAYAALVTTHVGIFELTPRRWLPWVALLWPVAALLLRPLFRNNSGAFVPVAMTALGVFVTGLLALASDQQGTHFAAADLALYVYAGALYLAYVGRTHINTRPEFEVLTLYAGHVAFMIATVRSFDSGLLISAIWGIFAVILLVIAVRARNKLLGQSSLLIFAASVLKILLLDLTGSPSIVRVATLVVAGATLYAGGWLYQRVVRD